MAQVGWHLCSTSVLCVHVYCKTGYNCTDAPGGEHQALADAAGLQVILIHLHILAEANQHPVYMCTLEPVLCTVQVT